MTYHLRSIDGHKYVHAMYPRIRVGFYSSFVFGLYRCSIAARGPIKSTACVESLLIGVAFPSMMSRVCHSLNPCTFCECTNAGLKRSTFFIETHNACSDHDKSH